MRRLIIILAAVLLVPARPQAPPPIVLSPMIPGDANVTATTVSIDTFQPDFDVYSWNTFIALNWPPGPDGNGDPNQTIGQNGDNDTVWEHYRDVSNIFLPGGARPTYYGQVPIPPLCTTLNKGNLEVVTQIGKNLLTPAVVSAMSQPFNTGPIIDQKGIYTRFQILVNKTMFDYILANSLYSRAGQKEFTPPVNFTSGSIDSNGKTLVEGAIMVKTAWKVIAAVDKPRFHSQEVLVYSPASKNPKYPAKCSMKTVGLVGMHVGHKTQSAPQWLWSTFEHVDNVPTDAEVKSGTLKAQYSYYNPACTTCKVNQIPPRPWDPTKVSAFHSQIVRMNQFNLPIYANSAAARNADAKKLLLGINQNSVWANYELISTMWPTDPTRPFGAPAPTFLANTTLETYIQGMVPNVSSNCIECHNNATMTVPVASDFTYVLQRALGPGGNPGPAATATSTFEQIQVPIQTPTPTPISGDYDLDSFQTFDSLSRAEQEEVLTNGGPRLPKQYNASGLNLRLFVQAGEPIVIDYKLDSDAPASLTIRVGAVKPLVIELEPATLSQRTIMLPERFGNESQVGKLQISALTSKGEPANFRLYGIAMGVSGAQALNKLITVPQYAELALTTHSFGPVSYHDRLPLFNATQGGPVIQITVSAPTTISTGRTPKQEIAFSFTPRSLFDNGRWEILAVRGLDETHVWSKKTGRITPNKPMAEKWDGKLANLAKVLPGDYSLKVTAWRGDVSHAFAIARAPANLVVIK